MQPQQPKATARDGGGGSQGKSRQFALHCKLEEDASLLVQHWQGGAYWYSTGRGVLTGIALAGGCLLIQHWQGGAYWYSTRRGMRVALSPRRRQLLTEK